jgi:hypothetical protein
MRLVVQTEQRSSPGATPTGNSFVEHCSYTGTTRRTQKLSRFWTNSSAKLLTNHRKRIAVRRCLPMIQNQSSGKNCAFDGPKEGYMQGLWNRMTSLLANIESTSLDFERNVGVLITFVLRSISRNKREIWPQRPQ